MKSPLLSSVLLFWVILASGQEEPPRPTKTALRLAALEDRIESGQEEPPIPSKTALRLAFLKDCSELEAAIRRYPAALELSRERASLARTVYARDPDRLADVLADLAEHAWLASKPQEAFEVLEEIGGLFQNMKPQRRSLRAADRLRYFKRLAQLTPAELAEIQSAGEKYFVPASTSGLSDTDALALADTGIRLREKALGYADSQIVREMLLQSDRLLRLGREKEALDRIERATEVQKKLVGENDPQVAECGVRAARAARKAGNLSRAEELLSRAAETDEEVFGLDHPTARATLSDLIEVQAERGRAFEKADDYAAVFSAADRWIRSAEKRWGPQSSQAQELRFRRALAEAESRLTQEQRQKLRSALEEYSKLRERTEPLDPKIALALVGLSDKAIAELAPDHPVRLEVVRGLLMLSAYIGEAEEMLTHLKEYIRLEEKTVGLDRPEVIECLGTVAAISAPQQTGFSLFPSRPNPAAMKRIEAAFASLGVPKKGPLRPEALVKLVERWIGSDAPLAFEYHRRVLRALDRQAEPTFGTGGRSFLAMTDYWYKAGRPDLALLSSDRAIPDLNPGAKPFAFAEALSRRAELCSVRGDAEGVFRDRTRANAVLEGVLGADHLVVCQNRLAIAESMHDRGMVAEAARTTARTLDSVRRSLAPIPVREVFRSRPEGYRILKRSLDLLVRIAPEAGLPADEVWKEVLDWKWGVIRDEEVADLFRMRAVQREDLDRLYRIGGVNVYDDKSDPRYINNGIVEARSAEALHSLSTPTDATFKAWRDEAVKLRGISRYLTEKISVAAKSTNAKLDRTRSPIEAVRGLVPPDGVLLDFYVHKSGSADILGSKLVAFIVRADRPVERVEFGDYEPIHRAICDWRKSVALDRSPDEKVVAVLRDRLVGPMRGAIGNAKLVLVSSDDTLREMPFAALPGRKPGDVLLDEYSFINFAGVRRLAESLAAPNFEGNDMYLAGEIDYSADPGKLVKPVARSGRSDYDALRSNKSTDFSPIAGSGKEIDSVAAVYSTAFRKEPVWFRRGDSSTELDVRTLAAGSRYLHFSTHGFFSDPGVRSYLIRDPVDREDQKRGGAPILRGYPWTMSGIALAGAGRPSRAEPGDRGDGILTAAEILEIDLSGTQLAVLSGSETDPTNRYGSEGVLTLQRAFQAAGVRTAIVGLWSAPDEATRALMVRMYRNLWIERMPAYEALLEAQRAMRAGWNPSTNRLDIPKKGDRLPAREAPLSPRYWAGFIASGSWK